MRRYTSLVLSAMLVTSAVMGWAFLPSVSAQNNTEDKAPTLEKIIFIDYGKRGADVHTGRSGDACGDGSRQFTTLNGGLKWASTSFPISFHVDTTQVTGVDQAAAKAALLKAFSTIDSQEHPAGQFFAETADSTTAKITVEWAALDGAGNALAQTSVWYNTATKKIVFAEITFDTADPWFVATTESCVGIAGSPFDIENVAVHEIGHAVGLGHVGDTKLTMYRYAAEGETLKRSLGVGDQRGIDKLY